MRSRGLPCPDSGPSRPVANGSDMDLGYRGATTRTSHPRASRPRTESAVTTDTPFTCGGYVSVQYRARGGRYGWKVCITWVNGEAAPNDYRWCADAGGPGSRFGH